MVEWGNYWAKAIKLRDYQHTEAYMGLFSQIGELYNVKVLVFNVMAHAASMNIVVVGHYFKKKVPILQFKCLCEMYWTFPPKRTIICKCWRIAQPLHQITARVHALRAATSGATLYVTADLNKT